ncbi:MAG TPA: AraC family transcriptional regulator [Pseudomonas sp.]|nr:AraC family transcriptional regulator [Pseudomonas sp.]
MSSQQLLSALANCKEARLPDGGTERLSPWQEKRAKALIADNLNSGLSMARLAQECGKSRCHFSRAFHGSTGMSPHQWLTRQRLERARQLMFSGLSLTVIAQECGFADQAHFSRVFARMTGLAPSRWRQEQLRGNNGRMDA